MLSAAPGTPAVNDLLSSSNESAQSPSTEPKLAPEVPPDPNAWREELAARLSNYRARRKPRAPRYPSLSLRFEPPAPLHPAIEDSVTAVPSPAPESLDSPQPTFYYEPAETGKIIEFPRLWEPPPRPADELAEPVFDQPRIIEVPEVVAPPPALGGILIEPAEEPKSEKRLGFDIPLQSAPASQRILATATDALLVSLAYGVFAGVFFKVTAAVPPLQPALTASVLLLALFWSAYQFVMTVYAGTTPGLKLARLRLSRFDGGRVPRRLRMWRAIASVLSGVSLGLGYAWCFLDEDGLCWHDRITRTYLAPLEDK